MTGSRGRVALLLLLTFAAGAAAGVAADRLSLLPGTARADESAGTEEERREDGGERPRTTIERFADELGLTAEQRSRIEEVLSAFRGEVKELRKEFHPRWEALVDSARARIEAVLTPEQVEQYRALLKRERAERRGDRKDEASRSQRGSTESGEAAEGEGPKADGPGGEAGAAGSGGPTPPKGREWRP